MKHVTCDRCTLTLCRLVPSLNCSTFPHLDRIIHTQNYPRGSRELLGPLTSSFGPKETYECVPVPSLFAATTNAFPIQSKLTHTWSICTYTLRTAAPKVKNQLSIDAASNQNQRLHPLVNASLSPSLSSPRKRWFTSLGVALKTEADGRMFPTTDSSQTIVDCLRKAAADAGVRVETGAKARWVGCCLACWCIASAAIVFCGMRRGGELIEKKCQSPSRRQPPLI
jgi:hypothetical protein